MSSKEIIRVRNAFNAMKAIGIKDTKVKPVLKTLLKVSSKNWELIEEKNYRVLADVIFAIEKAKEFEERTQATEETPRPLKRPRLRFHDGQGSSAAAPNSRVPLLVHKDEPCEIPESCGPPLNASQTVVESHQPVAEKNEGKQPTLDPSPLTDNAHLTIAQITSAVVTMHHIIEQFGDQTKRLSNSEKEALKALAAAEERAKRAEEIARASMVAEKNALLKLEQLSAATKQELHNSNVALNKMEKEKSAVEEQLKQVREVLEQAHKLAIGSERRGNT